MTDATAKLKPGYWIAWCRWYDSYEVVLVSSNCDTFDIMGYDLPTSVLSEDWKFIKPFDPEDIILNKELSNERD